MKINQEESIKLYLKIKTPIIKDNLYYNVNLNKNIFYLYNDKKKILSKEAFELNLDKIFTDENKNSFIYNHSCSNVIKDCLNGISFCFISHGETISDKLITLIGDVTNENNEDKFKGIFPRVLSELYNYINKNKIYYNDIKLHFSFIGVNNNKLIDFNNYFEKDITNFKGENFLKEGKSIKNDKNLINYIKKIGINNYKNILSFIFNNISLLIKLENENNDNFYSISHFVIILYITNNKGENISALTFILLNGSEKINLVENSINIRGRSFDFNNLSPEVKRKSIYASKCAINTQNAYNSIIYLIRQNKKINMNNNFKKDEEENNIYLKESKYISNLTAVLYYICFDWRIKNIKYIIFGNIYPNIGYYKSVKDSIFFLYELYKIIHKKEEILVLNENKSNSDSEDYEILNSSLFELENKVKIQNKTIDALNELLNKKNKKISFIQNEYNYQINQLKNSLGFKGDINILLSGDEYTIESKRAKKIRESGSKIKILTEKIEELEKKLKISNDEINKFKTKKEISKSDEVMIKYIESVNDIKDNKEKERKINSDILQKIDQLEKDLKNKNIIINELKNDLNNKNNLIQNFSNLIYINKNHYDSYEIKNNEQNDENKKEKEEKQIKKPKKEKKGKNNKNDKNDKNDKGDKNDFIINSQKITNLEKMIKEYEDGMKEDKIFWNNVLEEKDNKIENLNNKNKALNELNKNLEKSIEEKANEIHQLYKINDSNLLEIKKYENEILKINKLLMNIIHTFHLYFSPRSKTDIPLVSILNKVEDFSKLIIQTEKQINFSLFPILHKLLGSNNQISINYKTIINKINKQNLHITKSEKKNVEADMVPTKLSSYDLHQKISNILKNYTSKDKKVEKNNSDIILSKGILENMSKLELINHCIKLNERIIENEKCIDKYDEIKLENDENKKQINYLNIKIKDIKNALDEQVKINNKNKIVITSQNRTIEKYNKNNIDLNLIDNDEIEKLTMSLSPSKTRKTLHFNKSQINLKTNYDTLNNKYNNFTNKQFDIFTKNKNIKNKKIKEIQIPIDYYSIDSDNHINKTKLLYKSNSNTKYSSKKTSTSKLYLNKNDFSSSYNNFYSQN